MNEQDWKDEENRAMAHAEIDATLMTCPSCGATGSVTDRDAFVVTERVIRTWPVKSVEDGSSRGLRTRYALVMESGSDELDWESSTDTMIECRSCFDEFAVPPQFTPDWD